MSHWSAGDMLWLSGEGLDGLGGCTEAEIEASTCGNAKFSNLAVTEIGGGALIPIDPSPTPSPIVPTPSPVVSSEPTTGENLLVASLVSAMTLEEKQDLLIGYGWVGWDDPEGGYIGNVHAVERLGVPALKMHDAGQGFRSMRHSDVGLTTAWPSALGLASAWDPTAAAAFAAALADEFAAKGANVILGPCVDVQRVPRAGRAAESLSGEEVSSLGVYKIVFLTVLTNLFLFSFFPSAVPRRCPCECVGGRRAQLSVRNSRGRQAFRRVRSRDRS